MRIVLLCFAFLVFSSAAFAQSELFPHQLGPNGEILAPFADQQMGEDTTDPLQGLYDPLGGSLENSSEIDTPHRSDRQLGLWASDIIIRATSLTNRNYQTVFSELRPFFSEAGWIAYQTYLKQEGVLAKLPEGSYETASFVIQDQELLGKGVAGGAFKWVFDVPITFEQGKLSDKIRENVNIVVQVTRAPKNKGEHDVLIETWKIERLKR